MQLTILRATWSKFYPEGPEILGTTVQNLFTPISWHPGFVHPCLTFKSYWQFVISFHMCCEKLYILTSTINLLKLKANTLWHNCFFLGSRKELHDIKLHTITHFTMMYWQQNKGRTRQLVGNKKISYKEYGVTYLVYIVVAYQ